MNWLLIAGGSFLTAFSAPQEPVMMNHTLRGEQIPAKEVVCRNRWGTPMLPDGKGGYSLIAPINPEFIAQSLIQPPKPLVGSRERYVFRPASLVAENAAPVTIP
ncbi:MAG: hypothetical protein IAE94_03680 [Chthoniobacterales bacterium]|nr:hypothetical protein [Chthoniobacterales bacterium]